MLPVWFLGWSALRLWQLGLGQLGLEFSWLGRDFRIYRNAAEAVLSGSDPWAAFDTWNGTMWHFGAPPTAAQLFIPFALIPPEPGLVIFLVASVGLTFLALRRLGLPLWWILFPPMMEGIAAGNPQVPVFALLVVGSGVAAAAARAVAAGLKIYAVVPVIARREWRALAATGLLFAVSIILAPSLWAEYAANLGAVSGRLVAEAQGGISGALFLDQGIFEPLGGGGAASLAGLAIYGLLVALVVLVAIRDVRAAGWLFVPLLWPAGQYSNGSFVIPIVRPLSVWLIAVPTIPTYILGLIVLAYEVVAGRPATAKEPPAIGLIEWVSTLGRRTGGPIDES